MIFQNSINITTKQRGTSEITDQVGSIVSASGVSTGLCNVFIQHTSASLIITENADPTVRVDLDGFMADLVIDGHPSYRHNLEGDDDMSAHIRSVLTQTEITMPITNNRLALGTWQGIFVWEHRTGHFNRRITVTVYGE